MAYYLLCCSVDHSVYVGKEKIRFQENTFGKLCSHCRFVLFVFAALFDIAIVRSATMKKKLILLLFICLMAGNSYGQYSECLTGYPAIKVKYAPVQFSFWPLTVFHHETDVCGFRVAPGVFHLQGCVYGVSTGGFIATGTHCGLSLALCQVGYESNGILCGIVNVFERNKGVMLGLSIIVFLKTINLKTGFKLEFLIQLKMVFRLAC